MMVLVEMIAEVVQNYVHIQGHEEDMIHEGWDYDLQGWWTVDLDFAEDGKTPWLCVYANKPEVVDPETNYGCRVKGWNKLDCPLPGAHISWLNPERTNGVPPTA